MSENSSNSNSVVTATTATTATAPRREVGGIVIDAKNPMSALNERQRIALACKWTALKEAERDQYSEYIAAGVTDSATLYVLSSILTDANNKIFSEARQEYIGTLLQWYQSLVSGEAAIKSFAEAELQKIADKTTGAQQSTLLSALKAKLLANRTFLPEPVEKGFRALCRFFGFDLNLIK